MPIYEYECQACGEQLEAWQKLSEEPLKKCPACGEMKLKKLISAVGFRLKGGGWYETDFKSSGRKNVASDEKSGKKTSESKDNKSDTKLDSKKSDKDAGTAA